MGQKIVLLSICAFFARRGRGCTVGNPKAGAAATPLPRGQKEPTQASDLDIQLDIDIDIDSDNDNDNHENVENMKKMRKTKKHSVFTLGVVGSGTWQVGGRRPVLEAKWQVSDIGICILLSARDEKLHGMHFGTFQHRATWRGTCFVDVFCGTLWGTRGWMARDSRTSFAERCGELAGGCSNIAVSSAHKPTFTRHRS